MAYYNYGRAGACVNLASGRPTTSSDYREIYGPSSLVVDGNDSDLLNDPDDPSIPQCLYTIEKQDTAFWQVNLEQTVVIDHVVVIFRKGGQSGQRTHQQRRNGYSILVTFSSRYLPVISGITCYSDTNPEISVENHDNQSCSNIGRYVTIYNQRQTLSGTTYSRYAVLELCEVKVMGCPISKHGVNCGEDCSNNCFDNRCFPGNGTCMRGCKPGYTGPTCEKPCVNYFFGQNCVTECFCKTGPCNNVDGTCPLGGCEPGYMGTSCSTECVAGMFGDNCESKCGHCLSGRTTCDHRDGSCRSGCDPGYKVHTCIEVCDPGRYGRNCGSSCGRCLDGAPCHHINGTCLTGCAAGRQGTRCDTDCSPGMYGPNCEHNCGNCKEGQTVCNIINGSCPGGCALGWQGPLCKTACGQGHYGADCAERCGRCRDGQTCNRFNGTCENGCSPGWEGPSCKQKCLEGWYGDACREECGNCAGDNICNHVDGKCPKDDTTYRCDPGLKGEKCKTVCSSTQFGPDCRLMCGECFNSSCEPMSGNCTEGCLGGWSGVQCTEKLDIPDTSSASVGGIVGGLVGTVAAVTLVVIVVVVVMRRRRQKPYSTPGQPVNEQDHGVQYENMAAVTHVDEEANHKDQMTYENIGAISRNNKHQGGVMTENLLQEINRKEGCNEFETDFKEFPSGSQFPCEEATKENNKSRNRYKTTFPYDHSRVQLDGDQTYINANFIKDLDGTNAYVATQAVPITITIFPQETSSSRRHQGRAFKIRSRGTTHTKVSVLCEKNDPVENHPPLKATAGPKKNTLGDFWRMIWQLKTAKIIMLAKCVELGKPKVEQYWPDAGSTISHDGMKIRFISSKEYAAYTVRRMKLENEHTEETRVISQFHFLKWPDHGTPDVMHFALLLLHVDSVNSKLSGPIVVHCSAGVGRTGTFIASHVLFRHGTSTGRVDLPAYVQSMRQNRMDMVQTMDKCLLGRTKIEMAGVVDEAEDAYSYRTPGLFLLYFYEGLHPQYKFIYHALVELFLIDNTKLTMDDFGTNCLKSSRILHEYTKLNRKRPTIPEDLKSNGKLAKNLSKNRDPEILPSNQYRPLLSSHPANKTDYINAVFLPTIQRYEGYLATQWPLPETADDFWAMIYDYTSTAIVILDSDTDGNDPNLMPSETGSAISAGNFSVQTSSDPCTEGSITMAEVSLTKMGDKDSQKLKIFRMCDWPHDSQTCPEGCVTQMVYASQEWQRNVTSAGPTTVVCRNGSLKSGIFCTVANAIEGINLNQHTSLVQVVRQLQHRRPSFINTYESYIVCNREVKVHFDSLSDYQNYEGPS